MWRRRDVKESKNQIQISGAATRGGLIGVCAETTIRTASWLPTKATGISNITAMIAGLEMRSCGLLENSRPGMATGSVVPPGLLPADQPRSRRPDGSGLDEFEG